MNDIEYSTESTKVLFKAFELEQAGEWEAAVDTLFDRIAYSPNAMSQAWDYFCQMSELIIRFGMPSGNGEYLMEQTSNKDVSDPFNSAQLWCGRFITAFSLEDNDQLRALFDGLTGDDAAQICMAYMLRLTSQFMNKRRLLS